MQGEAQGYETGYQKGLLEGEALGQQAFNQAMAPLQAIGRALEELRQQNLADHTEHLCGLVEQVARRVIHAELSLNPDQLRKLVEDALSRMDTRKGEVTVFLSPDDFARLAEIGTDRIGGCPLQADESLSIGDCRLESDQQQQTVRSEERLAACVNKVREELSDGSALVAP